MPNTPIEVSAQADEWNSDDVVVFRNFLESTRTGRKILPKLLESTPPLLAGGEMNAILIRSGEVRGVQLIANAFLALANPLPEVVQRIDNYPPLEDDSKWNGDKPKPE